MQTYIGVDISKAFFDSSIGVRSMRCANTSSGFCDFMTQLPDDAWIVMECTGNYGSHLADTLVTHGYRVSMVNALQVKRFAQSRSKRAKTDKVDAKLLVEYAESLEQCHDERDRLRLWTPPTHSRAQLLQMRTAHALLIKERTMTSNQLEAMSVSAYASKEVVKLLRSMMKIFDKKINGLELSMSRIVDEHHSEEAKNLESIPGVARKTTVAVVAAVGEIARFATAKSLAAFCGLCPRVIESGTSVRGRGVLCNDGVTYLRTQLFMCAMSAIRWNEPCKQLYDRLVAKGKKKMVALLAVAHKLIRQIFAVLKYNTPFTPQPRLT